MEVLDRPRVQVKQAAPLDAKGIAKHFPVGPYDLLILSHRRAHHSVALEAVALVHREQQAHLREVGAEFKRYTCVS